MIVFRTLCSLKTGIHCLTRRPSRREILKALPDHKSFAFIIGDCIHHYHDQRNQRKGVPTRLPLHLCTCDETSSRQPSHHFRLIREHCLWAEAIVKECHHVPAIGGIVR
ncbi:hypothetical protein Y032_0062g3349 [Ancylostoma ceylanicum]|uniref:Uncharacterized protein n=1 Tax=Ancylostoma ceylanicum TaxID=53326 RepID=A0A016U1W7_9BILA|nr:hypothetical protein Y032_0062g3349 [Ancylostoma ceylanicum]